MRAEQQLLRRSDVVQEAVEISLDLFLSDRLALLAALSGEAPVVRVVLPLAALGPRSRHRLVAAIAVHEAAQREVVLHIGAGGCGLLPFKTVLNFEERLKAYERLVLGRKAIDVPLGCGEVARVQHLREKGRHLLRMHLAIAVLREQRLALQIPLHLGLGLESPGRKILQCLCDDVGKRTVRHKYLAAVTIHAVEAVAHGRHPCPIAVAHTRLHAVLGLLGVLLTLVLGDRGQKVLDEHAVGILAELDRRRFELAAGCRDRSAKLQMRLKTARKAADVIDQDDVAAVTAMLLEEGKQGQHAGPLDDTARRAFIPEHVRDLVALHARIVAAACLLRTETIAFAELGRAGDAAVDDSFDGGWMAHDDCFFLPFGFLLALALLWRHGTLTLVVIQAVCIKIVYHLQWVD